jgi:DNA-binding IclR family transcriptional regulator
LRVIAARTRAAGLARAEGDLLPRIAALSVPIFGHEAKLICAITALGWRGEFDTKDDSDVARILKATGGGSGRLPSLV